MIFAREVSDNLTSLVKKIDEATAKTYGMVANIGVVGGLLLLLQNVR